MSQLATRRESASDVAIVGMSCILPGRIDSTELLWKFLCDGGDAITEVPSTRWNAQAVYDPDPLVPGKTPSRWREFVPDIAAFDAGVYGTSPREAAVMDPQQRMLLEATWRAFEDAGFQVERRAGSRTGVYVGISYCDYNAIQRVGRDEFDVHTSTGSALSIAANRLSHRFDLRGPSLSMDTACSSSMVALDAACAALKSGECDLAVVGGVNAILTPDVTITFSRASMLSPDGRCKSFDSSANGYVRSEGAGVVVLKPLARARADGDRIHAIVLATAVNQDGRTETITVPNVNAQMALLQDVCRRGAIDPSHVRYVEAHGTGTPVGDPIEAEAIGAVFGRRGSGDGDDPCLLGSIKSNIGHLEPAAGIAGLIKATLCVEMGQIPPSLHFETPNPNIRFRELGIEVAATLRPFPETGLPRLAAVNSFGFGGTNACAIVQQAPAFSGSTRVERDQTWPVLLPISAVSEPALAAAASRLADSLENGISLADAAGTLAMRRSHLDYRAVASATSISDAVTSLRAFARGPVPEVVSGCRTRQPQMAFVFTGQGAQWWGMGRGLLERDPDFREAIETCDRIFARRAGWSLLEELAASRECAHKDPTFVAQPTLFALQVGLAARWKAWGVKPAAVIGHSVGELAAAYVCGALSLEDALAVVYHRSRLQERARLQGGMAAIGLAPQDAQRLIEENRLDLEVAAVNAQELVTVAGPRQDIERLLGKLRNNGSSHVFGQLLNVDYAFHSRQMDPFEQELRASLREIVSAQPSVPMFSTVSGSRVNANDLTADYWWRNMRQPVLFQTGIEALIDAGLDTFLELGPHATLSGPIRDCLARSGRDGIAIASLQREVDDQKTITAAAAELHVRGVDLAWNRLVPGCWKFVDLPKQQLAKSEFWAESEESRHARLVAPVHPLLGQRLRTATPTWQIRISAESPRFLSDHRIDGSVVFPAAGYVELMLAAAREHLVNAPWELENINFRSVLILSSATAVVETSLEPERGRIEVVSRLRGAESNWNVQASARVRAWSGKQPCLNPWHPKIEPPRRIDRLRFYRTLAQVGHEYGPAFQGLQTIWGEDRHVVGIISLPPAAGSAAEFLLHPALLDACFQVMLGIREFDVTKESETFALPISIERIRFFRRAEGTVFARAELVGRSRDEVVGNIAVIDDSGYMVAEIYGMHCRLMPRAHKREPLAGSPFYKERWIEVASSECMARRSEAPSSKVWLILADHNGVTDRLVKRIAERGDRSILVHRGSQMKQLDDSCFEVSTDLAQLKQDLQSIIATVSGVDGVVHLWPLDRADAIVTADEIKSAQDLGTGAVIALVQALAAA